VLSLLCLAGAVFLSRSRRRGLLHAAIGIALAMLLLTAGLSFARSAYLDALGSTALPRDAASDIFDTLVTFLRDGVRLVIIAAVVLAVVSFVAGMPLAALWGRLVTDQRRGWIALHRNALLLTVVAAGGLALLVRDAPGGGYTLAVVLLTVALCGVVTVHGLGADTATDAQEAEPAEQGVMSPH
jgi:hypothetical protein